MIKAYLVTAEVDRCELVLKFRHIEASPRDVSELSAAFDARLSAVKSYRLEELVRFLNPHNT